VMRRENALGCRRARRQDDQGRGRRRRARRQGDKVGRGRHGGWRARLRARKHRSFGSACDPTPSQRSSISKRFCPWAMPRKPDGPRCAPRSSLTSAGPRTSIHAPTSAPPSRSTTRTPAHSIITVSISRTERRRAILKVLRDGRLVSQ
jgi:hypothetical protein